jgi:ribosomal protein S18 acetylase RimI-like enzyme
MAFDLRVQPFSASLLAEVRDFHCGDQPWETEVSRWLTESAIDDCAVKWMERGTKVWLYRAENGEIVGYGSLGSTKWRMQPNEPRQPVSIIPSFALAASFQGEPRHLPSEERYATRIMRDLIAKADSLAPRILGLFVDKHNARAIAFYSRIGFQALPDEGGPYMKMFLDLS